MYNVSVVGANPGSSEYSPECDVLARRTCSWAAGGRPGCGPCRCCPRAGPWCWWRAPACPAPPPRPRPRRQPGRGAWAAWTRGRAACSSRCRCGPGAWARGRARSRPCRRPPGSRAPTCCDLTQEAGCSSSTGDSDGRVSYNAGWKFSFEYCLNSKGLWKSAQRNVQSCIFFNIWGIWHCGQGLSTYWCNKYFHYCSIVVL